jgi:hypothetical protein
MCEDEDCRGSSRALTLTAGAAVPQYGEAHARCRVVVVGPWAVGMGAGHCVVCGVWWQRGLAPACAGCVRAVGHLSSVQSVGCRIELELPGQGRVVQVQVLRCSTDLALRDCGKLSSLKELPTGFLNQWIQLEKLITGHYAPFSYPGSDRPPPHSRARGRRRTTNVGYSKRRSAR